MNARTIVLVALAALVLAVLESPSETAWNGPAKWVTLK
jgi:hypothetical protein